jgi:hypothetical protein
MSVRSARENEPLAVSEEILEAFGILPRAALMAPSADLILVSATAATKLICVAGTWPSGATRSISRRIRL